jgi:hypothetical protein
LLFTFGFPLLQVIILMMMLWPYSLRLNGLLFSSSFTFSVLLPCLFTPTDDIMLQRVLNHNGVNKLSQLSISVNFILWVTCLGSVPVYVVQTFRTIDRPCLPCPSVQHSVQE